MEQNPEHPQLPLDQPPQAPRQSNAGAEPPRLRDPERSVPFDDAQGLEQQGAALQSKGDKDIEENKDMAALSYVWALAVIVFLIKRRSPFVAFHARQGLILFVLSIAFWAVPFVGWILEFAVLTLCVLGFLHAAQGQKKELPIVGPLSRGDWHLLRRDWQRTVTTVRDIAKTKQESLKPKTSQETASPSSPPPPPPTPPHPPPPPLPENP